MKYFKHWQFYGLIINAFLLGLCVFALPTSALRGLSVFLCTAAQCWLAFSWGSAILRMWEDERLDRMREATKRNSEERRQQLEADARIKRRQQGYFVNEDHAPRSTVRYSRAAQEASRRRFDEGREEQARRRQRQQTDEEIAAIPVFAPSPWADPSPAPTPDAPSYSGHGGDFSGGGASGSWDSGSSSSDSGSSDSGSSSSDSGGSSGGGGD